MTLATTHSREVTGVVTRATKTANAKTANAKTANAKTANAKTAITKTANAKTANAKTANTQTANTKIANSKGMTIGNMATTIHMKPHTVVLTNTLTIQAGCQFKSDLNT